MSETYFTEKETYEISYLFCKNFASDYYENKNYHTTEYIKEHFLDSIHKCLNEEIYQKNYTKQDLVYGEFPKLSYENIQNIFSSNEEKYKKSDTLLKYTKAAKLISLCNNKYLIISIWNVYLISEISQIKEIKQLNLQEFNSQLLLYDDVQNYYTQYLASKMSNNNYNDTELMMKYNDIRQLTICIYKSIYEEYKKDVSNNNLEKTIKNKIEFVFIKHLFLICLCTDDIKNNGFDNNYNIITDLNNYLDDFLKNKQIDNDKICNTIFTINNMFVYFTYKKNITTIKTIKISEYFYNIKNTNNLYIKDYIKNKFNFIVSLFFSEYIMKIDYEQAIEDFYNKYIETHNIDMYQMQNDNELMQLSNQLFYNISAENTQQQQQQVQTQNKQHRNINIKNKKQRKKKTIIVNCTMISLLVMALCTLCCLLFKKYKKNNNL